MPSSRCNPLLKYLHPHLSQNPPTSPQLCPIPLQPPPLPRIALLRRGFTAIKEDDTAGAFAHCCGRACEALRLHGRQSSRALGGLIASILPLRRYNFGRDRSVYEFLERRSRMHHHGRAKHF